MDEEEVRFPCNLCLPGTEGHDKGFANARALGSHLRAKHGIPGQSRASQFRHRAAERNGSAEGRIVGVQPNFSLSQADLEARIAGSDVVEYIGLVKEMADELNRLWALENQFHRVIEQSSLFRAALEEVQQDERIRNLGRLPTSPPEVVSPESALLPK